MILPIVAYGSSVLRKECDEIEENADISSLIDNMFETMYAAKGVGLACPQIGQAIRMFVVDAAPFSEEEAKNEEEANNLEILKNFKKVFVNPIIEEESGKDWPFSEGCLSIPGIREDVTRKGIIHISYYDENWNYHEDVFSGIAARIIQHEYDHLEGILIIDKNPPIPA